MDLDQIKSAWNSQKFKAPDTPPTRRLAAGPSRRVNAFGEQLKARFRTMTVLSALMAGVAPPVGNEIGFPRWLTAWMSAYFLAMIVSHCTMWAKLRELDFGRCTLTGALDTVMRLRRGMTLRLAFGMAMAAPLLAVMMLCLLDMNMSMFYGGFIGLTLGGLAGDRKSVV